MSSNQRWPAPSETQTLLFARSSGWTERQAKEWARNHGKKHGKVHTTPQHIRVRQADPKLFVPGTMRTISFSADRGISAVVGVKRSRWPRGTPYPQLRAPTRTAKAKAKASMPRHAFAGTAVLPASQDLTWEEFMALVQSVPALRPSWPAQVFVALANKYRGGLEPGLASLSETLRSAPEVLALNAARGLVVPLRFLSAPSGETITWETHRPWIADLYRRFLEETGSQ